MLLFFSTKLKFAQLFFSIYGDTILALIRGDHTPELKGKIKGDMTCIINNGVVYDNDF